MDNTDINNKVSQALDAFDSISPLSPTDEWQDTLMSRLTGNQPKKRLQNSHVLLFIFVALILGGNVAFGLRMLSTEISHSGEANSLEAVSNEFLINPVSAKN